MISKKKVAFDILFNIVATIIPTIILQLVAYPIIGRNISANEYGLMITMFSCIQLFSATLGTGLNNVRLLKENECNDSNGSFNLILLIDCLAVAIIIFIASYYYQKGIDVISLLLVNSIAILMLINSYIDVEYRINLNFKKVLIENIAYAVGYAVGILVFLVIEKWEIVIFFGQLLCFIYNWKNTNILKESFRKSRGIKGLYKDNVYICISGFCARAISYADKLLLLPLIGGANVSIYYTSTLLGKIVLMGMTPITSVILSYLNKRSRVENKTFRRYFILGVLGCFVGYILCIAVSKPILSVLFPQWVDEAMVYIPVTTLSLCIVTLCNFLTPFTMKFCDMYWQFIIDFVTMIIYICLSLILLKTFGLIGFCWGINISYFVKLIIIMLVYILKKKEQLYSN